MLEIGGKNSGADGCFDVGKGPESALVNFVGGRSEAGGVRVDKNGEGIDLLALDGALEDVGEERCGCFDFDAKLFARFAAESGFDSLAVIDMSPHGGVPLAGLDVFEHRAALQIEGATVEREDMEVDYRVKNH